MQFPIAKIPDHSTWAGKLWTSAAFGIALAIGPNATKAEDAMPVPASTEAQPQIEHTHHYFVVNQQLPAFLILLGRDAGIKIDTSRLVRGTVRGKNYDGGHVVIIDQIARDFDLDWFEFNGVYYLSARSETVNRLIRLGNLSQDRVRDALTEAGLASKGFPIQSAADGTALALSGPPKLLGLSEAVIESIPPLPAAETSATQVRIRRANSLTAIDPQGG